jgi:hypothetical protein
MDPITIGIGTALIIYGVYTARLRARAPERMGRLQAMKTRFGADTGLALHITAFSVLPFVVGFLLAFAGLNGLSLLTLF